MSERRYPHELRPISEPIPAARVERVLAGMGKEGVASRALVESGQAPPELATALTLALLQGQPRDAGSGGAGAVSGGVWVRECFTVHAPVPLEEPLTITGASLRRYTRKGRRYATTRSETRDARGHRIATNLTTGLERYRADAGADASEGLPESAVEWPAPDPDGAPRNPARERLRACRSGERIEGGAVEMSLARLRDRDGPEPANPIHSDPEAARRAGLDVPIAGGAHLLAFAQELVLQAFGNEALSHGACTDVRWLAPVRAGTSIVPSFEVADAGPDLLELALEIRCDGVAACVSSIRIPI